MKDRYKWVIVSVLEYDLPIFWTGARWTEHLAMAKKYSDLEVLKIELGPSGLGSVIGCIPADLNKHALYEVISALVEAARVVGRNLP